MEARSKKTIEELQKLEAKLSDVEKEKKAVEKKYSQVLQENRTEPSLGQRNIW